ncbi:MAG: AtpZ/AtpI family protein [Proteobacteria bacterium]|nr:AtpZ/AtpI family protein [Pseudomonadota bacterium]
MSDLEEKSIENSGELSTAAEDRSSQPAPRDGVFSERRLGWELRQTASMGSFALFLGLAVVFGYVIGRYLDNWLGTGPYLTIFWVLCGVAASVMELIKLVRKAKLLGDPTHDPKS